MLGLWPPTLVSITSQGSGHVFCTPLSPSKNHTSKPTYLAAYSTGVPLCTAPPLGRTLVGLRRVSQDQAEYQAPPVHVCTLRCVCSRVVSTVCAYAAVVSGGGRHCTQEHNRSAELVLKQSRRLHKKETLPKHNQNAVGRTSALPTRLP